MALAASLAVPTYASTLTGVTVGASGARIALDAPADYRAFRLSEPDRFVVDLRDTVLGVSERSWPGAGSIKGVRAGPFGETETTTRVVFDLTSPLEAGTRDAAGGLLVEFHAPAAPAAEHVEEAAPAEPESPASPDFKDALAPLAVPAPAAVLMRPSPAALPRPVLETRRAAASAPRLLAVEAGPERVDLTLAGPFEPTIFLLPSPPRLVIDLRDVDASVFPAARPAPGGTVLGARAAGRGGSSRVVLDLAWTVPYSVRTGEGTLSILFEPATPEKAPTRTREYKGWVVDGSGRPQDGVFLVRFSVPDDGVLDSARWEESVYVDARGGRFSAILGRGRPLPAGALPASSPLDAAAPAGVAYRVVPR